MLSAQMCATDQQCVICTFCDRERKKTEWGGGREKPQNTRRISLDVCANLGDELFAALAVGWRPQVWPVGLEEGEKDKRGIDEGE